MPFAAVLTPGELVEDPQHQARRFFSSVEHPEIGELLQVGAPFWMTDTPWKMERAPLLGEHTTALLHERLGLDKDAIWNLKRDGIL